MKAQSEQERLVWEDGEHTSPRSGGSWSKLLLYMDFNWDRVVGFVEAGQLVLSLAPCILCYAKALSLSQHCGNKLSCSQRNEDSGVSLHLLYAEKSFGQTSLTTQSVAMGAYCNMGAPPYLGKSDVINMTSSP